MSTFLKRLEDVLGFDRAETDFVCAILTRNLCLLWDIRSCKGESGLL